jgi:hypothetical protein
MTFLPFFDEKDVRELLSGSPALETLDLGRTACFENYRGVVPTGSIMQCFQ